jgi:NAD(P)-dependent dehydrogenase (short-subunit alcohol dehydrogenase family)
MDLSSSVVLVTGASSGIGAATAQAASRAGARVVLVARRQDRIRQLATDLGDDALAVGCDVTDAGQVADAVRAAMDKFGRLDVLVNNAGQGLTASIEETDPADFRAILDLNLTAPLITMQAVLPVMRAQGGGAIVNVSSGTVFSVLPLSGAYAASKQGLAMLSATARLELADAGIVVSTFYPFVTSTEFIDSIKAGKEAATQMLSDGGLKAQPPELAADAIIDLIRSGAERADMVPQQFGGTYQD